MLKQRVPFILVTHKVFIISPSTLLRNLKHCMTPVCFSYKRVEALWHTLLLSCDILLYSFFRHVFPLVLVWQASELPFNRTVSDEQVVFMLVACSSSASQRKDFKGNSRSCVPGTKCARGTRWLVSVCVHLHVAPPPPPSPPSSKPWRQPLYATPKSALPQHSLPPTKLWYQKPTSA